MAEAEVRGPVKVFAGKRVTSEVKIIKLTHLVSHDCFGEQVCDAHITDLHHQV